MKRLYLRDVEAYAQASVGYAELIRSLRSTGAPCRPQATEHLERFSQAVMRGPSPLSPDFASGSRLSLRS
jgi:hypothetical protein